MELLELVQSIDAVDFFSQYTELTQRGREWWGLTPFQDEKTPSFSVDPDRKIFYCFSTGCGGNALDFLQLYYHCTFKDAVKILENYCGIDAESLANNKRLAATKVCKRFKHKGVINDKSISSKVLPETYMDKYIKHSHLDDWLNEGMSQDVLDKFQVRYDPLSNRIVYPIRNLVGEIVNVGGRTLEPNWKDKGLKKYCYYQSWGKISVIYGMYENIDSILESRNLILFEGCKSVLIANTWGIENCGAILTSHLGKGQMMTLLEFCSKNRVSLTFALDKEINISNDKNIEKLKKYLNIYFLWDRDNLLPDPKMSPVDMGKEVFEKLLCQKLKL